MTTLCFPTFPDTRFARRPPQAERRQSKRKRDGSSLAGLLLPGRGPCGGCLVRVCNISRHGISLLCHRSVAVDSVLELTLSHTGNHFWCRLPVRIVYAMPRRDGNFILGGFFTRPLGEEEARGLMPPSAPSLEVRQEGAVVVGAFPFLSPLDDGAIRSVREQLEHLVEERGSGPYVLDFGRVEGFTSAMLSQLLGFRKRVLAAGGRLALCGLAPDNLLILQRLNLASLFRIFPTEEEARQAV